MGIRQLTYISVFEIITFIAVDWITGWTILAFVCATISGILASKDWRDNEKNNSGSGTRNSSGDSRIT